MSMSTLFDQETAQHAQTLLTDAARLGAHFTTLGPDESAGTTGSTFQCALARYLHAQGGSQLALARVCIDDRDRHRVAIVVYGDGEARAPLLRLSGDDAPWLLRFVTLFDAEARLEVSARTAQRLLAQALRSAGVF